MRDIGANLANKAFEGKIGQTLDRARAAGIVHIDVTGTSAQASREALELARAHPDFLSASAGQHPHHAKDWNSGLADEIERLLGERLVLMAGEMGLDCEHEYSPYAAQKACFADQLEIAKKFGKPLFLHFRGERALDDGLSMLASAGSPRGIVHCFTGNAAQAKRALDLGLDLGFTGWVCDPRRGQEAAQALRMAPGDRIHLETDAPFLLPKNKPGRGKRDRCEPADLEWVAQGAAELMGKGAGWLKEATRANSDALIGYPASPSPKPSVR